jgi:hypothetical protein
MRVLAKCYLLKYADLYNALCVQASHPSKDRACTCGFAFCVCDSSKEREEHTRDCVLGEERYQ